MKYNQVVIPYNILPFSLKQLKTTMASRATQSAPLTADALAHYNFLLESEMKSDIEKTQFNVYSIWCGKGRPKFDSEFKLIKDDPKNMTDLLGQQFILDYADITICLRKMVTILRGHAVNLITALDRNVDSIEEAKALMLVVNTIKEELKTMDSMVR